MPAKNLDSAALDKAAGIKAANTRVRRGHALLQAGALQRAIFNSANFSSIATDAKGVIQIFNVGAERMLGYTAAEVMNKITPADISDPQEVIARAKALSVELGTPISPGFEALVFKASRGIEDIYELTYIRKDGSRFPAVVSVTALRDAQDAIIGYLLIGTDNTARKQAEETLPKAGALQRAIFNSAHFSSIATDAKGVIQIFNVGAERMLGYAAADVMNKITPADISDPQEVIARAKALSVELGTPITPGFEALVFKASRGIEDIYELTYIRKDGSRFPAVVSVTALRDAQNAIIGYLLIGTDNTARKQAEEAQLRLVTIVSATPDFVGYADARDTHIIYINPAGRKMIGAGGEEDVTRLKIADVHPEWANKLFRDEIIPAAIRDGVWTGECAFLNRDGREIPVMMVLLAQKSPTGEVDMFSTISRDITERKRVEAAMAEALRAKSEFMANVTHELRTPLNSVIGFAGLLKDEVPGPLNAKQTEFAGDILASGERLLRLVEGILEMSRLDATGAAIEREPVEIGAALQECVAARRKTAEARGVSVRLDVAAETGSASLDAKALRRMLDALIDNAIKFNRDGGAVALSARRKPGWLEIAVADTGVGIAREDLPKLFRPLAQLDSGLPRQYGGIGLGLALARRLAELHGGTIEAESESGKGSTFTLRLPVGEHA